jgi:outer membrane receptor protein involved in Fe transport
MVSTVVGQPSAIDDFISVERVEILRGPQSSVYGKNTPAGVISIITKKPEQEFGLNFEQSFGNYGSNITRASVTGPAQRHSVLSHLR